SLQPPESRPPKHTAMIESLIWSDGESRFREESGVSCSDRMRVGYVVSRYPVYSETFIVNEILAHERAGLAIEIFALRPPADAHFQDLIASVRSPVRHAYFPETGLTSEQSATQLDAFWKVVQESSKILPGLWPALEATQGEEIQNIYQGLLIAREVQERSIGHLHAHFAWKQATVARLAARFAGVPYTFTAHAVDIFSDRVRPDYLRRNLNDAATVVTVSDYNVDFLRRSFGPAAAKAQRIYCGLDLERFSYQSPQDRPMRIVAVGRLVEKKGFADLIQACALLANRNCQFSCWIIGEGELKESLRAQIEELGLITKVELIGPRPQIEVIRLVREAAVFALPCVIAEDGNRDGLPVALMEAMALGTPCVSTDVTGIPELLRNGHTGLMVRQHDPDALATAIERLLTDQALRMHLAHGARRLIEAKFDVHCNTKSLRAIFQNNARIGERAVREVD
ncbi:MAG: glycosyltransferase, partial [Vicinamibacterales bacterium]